MQAVVVTGAGGELKGDTCSGVCCWQDEVRLRGLGGRSVSQLVMLVSGRRVGWHPRAAMLDAIGAMAGLRTRVGS